MKREFSAGGVVFNNEGEVLLIQNSSMREARTMYWGFPKGHIEDKESSKEAALREVSEETEVEVEIVDKVGDSKYVFGKGENRIFKIVIIYLMKYTGGELKHQSSELLDAKWVEPKEAMKMLSFQNDKKLLKDAITLKNKIASSPPAGGSSQ